LCGERVSGAVICDMVCTMSSRSGPRAAGTDGTDFRHRQRVAAHYQYRCDGVADRERAYCSVQYKSYLKWLFVMHTMVLVAMWVKVGGEFLVRELDLKWPFYSSLDLPSAYPWEYIWSLSFVPMLFALASFQRNKVSLLRVHYYGQFLSGILPCAIGMGGQLPELVDYLSDMEHSQTPTFKGTFPMVIIWYIFFLVAIQIHGFAMYFSYHLTASWQPPKKRD
uniref:Protein jagunal-like protein n=1 Tax=Toxocara canis TaxID=6265 RepID=A0A183V2P0_TOXCA